MSIYETLSKIPLLRKPLYNVMYKYIARQQQKRFANHLRKIKTLKDLHTGESCFIIGTGPSLRIEDLKLIKEQGIVTFAPNRIYEITEKYDWNPTYYICQDHNLIKTFGDRIKKIKSQLSFIPVEYVNDFQEEKFRFFVLRERDFYPHDSSFSFDTSHYIDQGYTVTYGAIQLAIYMGFKKIYLIGIDHNYSIIRDSNGRPVRKTNVKSDYSEGMTQYINESNLPRIEESTIAYETAEKISKKLGVKIYNATRGGKLEAFERIDLNKLLKQQNI